jgi:hypothetical protein
VFLLNFFRSMLENSFYWDFKNLEDPTQKSNFITFIQEKNREIHSQQRISNHKTASGTT